MKKSTITEEIEYFQALNYDDKLRYFDDGKVNFLYDAYSFGSNEHFISIRPNSIDEIKSYNKWIIDHWRNKYKGEFVSNEVGINLFYRSIEELLTYYQSATSGINSKAKISFIEKEIEFAIKFAVRLKIDRKVLSSVHSAFYFKVEENLYSFAYSASLVLNKLQQIGKSWDIVKYLVFLRNEKQKLLSQKVVIDEYVVTPIVREKIEEIFEALLQNGFIAKSSDKEFFIKLFSNENVKGQGQIKWIDDDGANNGLVNKLTLITLIDNLVGDDVKNQNYFMKTFFVVEQRISNGASDEREIVVLDTENVKQSRKLLKQKGKGNISPRQKLINEIAKFALNT